KKYIFSALSVNEIAIIPPSLDGVSISSANAVRSNSVDAMFVIGAIKGIIPMEKSDEGMFSDNERNDIDELLKSEQREIGGSTKEYIQSEEYKLFRVLFSAKKLLTISYPLNDFNGEAQMPSQVIADLKKIFKNITINGDLSEADSEIDNYFTVNSALDYLLKNRNNKNDKFAKKIYNWFLENDKEKLDVIKNSDLYKAERAKIKSKNAELLYNEMLDYSASRLKMYADCPFQYFIKYGLGAKPEEVWQIQKFDLGTLMHYIICKYCEIIEGDADSILELRKRWSELTDEESDKIIDDIIRSLSKKIISAVGKDEDKINYLLLRIKNIIKKSVEIVRISLTKGEYTAVEYEKSFSMKIENNDRKVGIRGTIDRIDIALYDEENAGIRIIDYKSGKKDFSVVSVCNMQDVQLILYATAATELFRLGNIKYSNPSLNAKITGIMYNKLKDSIIDANDVDKSNINEKKLKDMQLSGVVVLEENEENLDISDAIKMDMDIEKKGESSFMNFSLKNDGTPKQTSNVLSRNSFDKLTAYVKKKIIDADLEIMNGNIEISPFLDGNKSACDYCEMSEICLFDKTKDSVRKLCKNKEDAWEIIDKELQK
ncbi:MAG: PD-(D/E)XK nuclease family protein, partial [Clostridia bacterium]|nr:PD-(D/E)XK nuclease family protein [Clostridia bacterium]